MVIVSLIPRATPSSFGSTLHVYILTLRNSSCIVLLILFNVILLYIIDKCLFPYYGGCFHTECVSLYRYREADGCSGCTCHAASQPEHRDWTGIDIVAIIIYLSIALINFVKCIIEYSS